METANWISLVGGMILQIIGLIIVLWQFSIRMARKNAERDATLQGRLNQHDSKFIEFEKCVANMQKDLERMDEQFNHRFTEYKNEVIALLKELKVDRDKSFTKLENQLVCITRQTHSITLDLAFFKGERKKEGKSRFPSQKSDINDDDT